MVQYSQLGGAGSSQEVVHGDCLSLLRRLRDDVCDAGVIDPPYELGFMGREWDSTGIAFSVELWREMLRVLKPGAHIAVHAAGRLYHHLGCAVEDAGFEVREMAAWIFGTGQFLGRSLAPGVGTRLKTGVEPILIARKPPVIDIAVTYSACGTGGLQIERNRLGYRDAEDFAAAARNPGRSDLVTSGVYGANRPQQRIDEAGRLPSGVLIDEAVAEELGDRARYFYCVKASRTERDAGLEAFAEAAGGELTGRREGSAGLVNSRAGAGRTGGGKNRHVSVKPLALARWLVRLLTPPRVYIWKCVLCGHESPRQAEVVEAAQVQTMHNTVSPPRPAEPLLLREVPGEQPAAAGSALPRLQEAVHPSAVGSASLQSSVRQSIEAPFHNTEVRTMREAVHADRESEEVLFAQMRSSSVGSTAPQDRRAGDSKGIHFNTCSRASDGVPNGLCDGASAGYGEAPRPRSDGVRSSTPPKRNQTRQSNTESSADAERGARQNAQAAEAEDRTMPPLSKRICTQCGQEAVAASRPAVVLDIFAGSGTTLCAAALEGVSAIGFERENTPEMNYVDIARARLAHWRRVAIESALVVAEGQQAVEDTLAEIGGERPAAWTDEERARGGR